MEEGHCGQPAMRMSSNDKGRLIRPHRQLLLLLWFVVVHVTALLHGSERSSGGIPESPLPTHLQISHAIALSAGYMERACGADGKFVYEIDINTGKQSSSYNIVRHAGAIYALAMLNRSRPDRKAVGAMVRAASFMRKNYIGPGVRPGQVVVWSEPTSRRTEAELGATGLGLVALAEVRKVAPKAVPLDELQALGRFALFLQKEDGFDQLRYDAKHQIAQLIADLFEELSWRVQPRRKAWHSESYHTVIFDAAATGLVTLAKEFDSDAVRDLIARTESFRRLPLKWRSHIKGSHS
jgi:hypothetical protein